MSSKHKDQVIAQLKRKYEHMSDEDIAFAFDIALTQYVFVKYPSMNNRPNIEDIEFDFYLSHLLFMIVEETINRAGGSNVVAYKENGMSWTYATDGLSDYIRSLIMPQASVPR